MPQALKLATSHVCQAPELDTASSSWAASQGELLVQLLSEWSGAVNLRRPSLPPSIAATPRTLDASFISQPNSSRLHIRSGIEELYIDSRAPSLPGSSPVSGRSTAASTPRVTSSSSSMVHNTPVLPSSQFGSTAPTPRDPPEYVGHGILHFPSGTVGGGVPTTSPSASTPSSRTLRPSHSQVGSDPFGSSHSLTIDERQQMTAELARVEAERVRLAEEVNELTEKLKRMEEASIHRDSAPPVPSIDSSVTPPPVDPTDVDGTTQRDPLERERIELEQAKFAFEQLRRELEVERNQLNSSAPTALGATVASVSNTEELLHQSEQLLLTARAELDTLRTESSQRIAAFETELAALQHALTERDTQFQSHTTQLSELQQTNDRLVDERRHLHDTFVKEHRAMLEEREKLHQHVLDQRAADLERTWTEREQSLRTLLQHREKEHQGILEQRTQEHQLVLDQQLAERHSATLASIRAQQQELEVRQAALRTEEIELEKRTIELAQSTRDLETRRTAFDVSLADLLARQEAWSATIDGTDHARREAVLREKEINFEADHARRETTLRQREAEFEAFEKSLTNSSMDTLATQSHTDLCHRILELERDLTLRTNYTRLLVDRLSVGEDVKPSHPLGVLSDSAKKALFEKMELLLTEATTKSFALEQQLRQSTATQDQLQEHITSLEVQLEDLIARQQIELMTARGEMTSRREARHQSSVTPGDGEIGEEMTSPGNDTNTVTSKEYRRSKDDLIAELDHLRNVAEDEIDERRRQCEVELNQRRLESNTAFDVALSQRRTEAEQALEHELSALKQHRMVELDRTLDQLKTDRMAELDSELDQARALAQSQLEEEFETERDQRFTELNAEIDEARAKAEAAALQEAKQLNALKADRLVALSAQIASEVTEMRDQRMREVEQEVEQILTSRVAAKDRSDDSSQVDGKSSAAPAYPVSVSDAASVSSPMPAPEIDDFVRQAQLASLEAELADHRSSAVASLQTELATLRASQLQILQSEHDAEKELLTQEFTRTRERLLAELTDMRDKSMQQTKRQQQERTQAMVADLERQKQEIKRQWFKEVSQRRSMGTPMTTSHLTSHPFLYFIRRSFLLALFCCFVISGVLLFTLG